MNTEELQKEIETLQATMVELPPEERLKLLQELNRLVSKANSLADKLVK